MSIIIGVLAFLQSAAFIRKSDAAWDAGERETAWRWLAAAFAMLIVETSVLVLL